MSDLKITESYNKLGKIIRLVLQFFFGYIISGVYRIVKYVENQKNILTLVIGILCLVTVVGNAIAWVVDFITLLLHDKYVYFAE